VRLGELLLSEKRVTQAQLEEALEAQVVHGGRLGTNLVELGFLNEVDLCVALGRLNNLPYASGDMVPDPNALALVPPQYCDDHDLLPMRQEATRLTVVVLGFSQMKSIDELSFKVGKRIVSVVIPEFRMNQLLRKYCKAFRPMRPLDMNSLRPSVKKANQGPVPSAAGDLINEDDFANLYAQAAGGADEALQAELIEDVPSAASIPLAPRKAPDTLHAAEAEASPLSFAQAQALLAKSTSREDIAETVLRFARSKFKRVLILNVQGDLTTGWRGLGIGVHQALVRRIGVSLREANTLKLVRDLKSHFVGPIKPTPGMEVFYKLLGGGFPTTAVLMPLLVREKLVHLLYVDQGPGELTPPDVGELLIVSQSVTRSYEALIKRRKHSSKTQ
jgi:Type II secretion system (T2SS), protein E, N-terminal domain